MSNDRFINFSKRPAKAAIAKFLADFVGEAGRLEWSVDRWIITLVGKPSACFKQFKRRVTKGYRELFELQPSRWIEVWPGQYCIDVLTRTMDEFTNAVAEGMAKCIARFWDGSLEA